jgi:hypothetical protein
MHYFVAPFIAPLLSPEVDLSLKAQDKHDQGAQPTKEKRDLKSDPDSSSEVNIDSQLNSQLDSQLNGQTQPHQIETNHQASSLPAQSHPKHQTSPELASSLGHESLNATPEKIKSTDGEHDFTLEDLETLSTLLDGVHDLPDESRGHLSEKVDQSITKKRDDIQRDREKSSQVHPNLEDLQFKFSFSKDMLNREIESYEGRVLSGEESDTQVLRDVFERYLSQLSDEDLTDNCPQMTTSKMSKTRLKKSVPYISSDQVQRAPFYDFTTQAKGISTRNHHHRYVVSDVTPKVENPRPIFSKSRDKDHTHQSATQPSHDRSPTRSKTKSSRNLITQRRSSTRLRKVSESSLDYLIDIDQLS